MNTTLEETLFKAAVQLEPEKRAAFLQANCGSDPAVRKRLDALLAAHDASPKFMSKTSTDCEIEVAAPREYLVVEGQKIGRYKILEKVGEGGCGVVYVAEQLEPIRRRVALKVIKLGMDTKQVVARFEAERQALAMMDHPNIAKVLDAGATEQGRPYFVMELVRGIRITDYCDQNHLSTKERLDLFGKVCQAIQHAHQKGIIHRDIKPSNILVTLHDGVPVPKVIDFGIAKATEGRLTDATVYTQLQQFIGTPAYMSPEQAEMSGLDIDTRSDIYSLGVLLYELLTGKTPFDSAELIAAGIDGIRQTIREKEPLRPSTKLANLEGAELATAAQRRSSPAPALIHLLQGDLDWIVMKCLEKDRTRRYDTANGLAAEVQRHLTNEPVVARPPSALYRMQKAWRRNRVIFSAAAIAIFALLAATAISISQVIRVTKARGAEAEARRNTEAARAVAEAEKATSLGLLRNARRLAYFADIPTVEQALRSNNVTRARQILNQYRPTAAQEDIRDWEWFYLERRAWADDGAVVATHPGGPARISTARDRFVVEHQVVNGHLKPGLIQVFDSDNWKLLTRFNPPADSKAMAISHDGQQVAILRPLTIEIRSLVADFKLLRTLTTWRRMNPHANAEAIAFINSDAELLVAGIFGQRGIPLPLTVIDVEGDTSAPAFREGEGLPMVTLRISNEFGRGAALVQNGRELLLFDSHTRSVMSRIRFDRALTRPPAMAFQNANSIVIGTEFGNIDLWDIKTGQHTRRIGEHGANVADLAVSTGGDLLASAGHDQLVKVWPLSSTSSFTNRSFRGHEGAVTAVTFSRDARTVITCGQDGSVRQWSLQADRPVISVWGIPHETSRAIFRSSMLVTSSSSDEWMTWDIGAIPGATAPSLIERPANLGNAVVIPLVNTAYFLVVEPNFNTERWRGMPITLLRRRGTQTSRVESFPKFAILGANGVQMQNRTLFIYGRIERVPHVLVWDLVKERIVYSREITLRGGPAMCVAVDEKTVFVGNDKGSIERIDLSSGTSEVWTNAFPEVVRSMAISADNRTMFATGGSGTLRRIDWPTRKFIELPAALESISEMCLSPSGKRLITGDAQGVVKIWEADTLRELMVLGTHSGPVGGVQFQPDGTTLLSVDRAELKVWRADVIGKVPSL
jgi:serine/threonine protein kinase/WD40 repeat protein